MGRILNLKKLRKRVSDSKSVRRRIGKIFEKQLVDRQRKLVADFDNHPVTQEIQAGRDGSNISKTLNGYGNLYTFLGFSHAEDPTSIIRNYLAAKVPYRSTSSRNTAQGFAINFKANLPGIRDIEALSALSHLGRSWVTGVERGKVDGFQYYLNSRRHSSASRSGKGIQIDKRLRNTNVKPIKYVNHLLERFRKSLEKIK
jgi:hypothetical protein